MFTYLGIFHANYLQNIKTFQEQNNGVLFKTEHGSGEEQDAHRMENKTFTVRPE